MNTRDRPLRWLKCSVMLLLCTRRDARANVQGGVLAAHCYKAIISYSASLFTRGFPCSVLFFSHLCYTNETKGTQENTTIWRYLPCMMTQTKGSSNTDSSSTDNSLLASNPHRTNSSMDNSLLGSSPHRTNNSTDNSPHHTDNNN